MISERTDHPSYAEAKKLRSITIRTPGVGSRASWSNQRFGWRAALI